MNIKVMTNKDINDRLEELRKVLDFALGDEWDVAYDEYLVLSAELDARYRDENIDKFETFFFKNVYGKEWKDIDDDTWGFYSDWHKDMFGYRPKSTDKDW